MTAHAEPWETTREQDNVIELFADYFGAVCVEPTNPDGRVTIVVKSDHPTPLGLVLDEDGKIVGGGAA